MNTKLTILYERLSREDERETESISIENQKAFLEDYATQNGFTNLLHLTDDGWSGTRWDRPSYLRLIEEVERGNVAVNFHIISDWFNHNKTDGKGKKSVKIMACQK